jgi:aminopeptidase-like protein
MTHNSLLNAIQEDYETLGDSLKKNEVLLSIDFSYNDPLDEELAYHTAITECILEAGEQSGIKKLHMTSKSLDIKSHYLDVID